MAFSKRSNCIYRQIKLPAVTNQLSYRLYSFPNVRISDDVKARNLITMEFELATALPQISGPSGKSDTLLYEYQRLKSD